MDINAYAVPGCPSYQRCPQGVHIEGNAGRNSIRMPGLNNWDLSVLKDTHLSGAMLLQFRSEFFNVWNHTQFRDAFLNLTAGQFGRITTVRVPPRDIQFGLKLIF